MMGLVAGLWAKAWPKIVAIGAAIVGFIVLVGMIRKGGRDAERRAELETGLEKIKKANEAAASLDHSQGAIDEDPNNLDRGR